MSAVQETRKGDPVWVSEGESERSWRNLASFGVVVIEKMTEEATETATAMKIRKVRLNRDIHTLYMVALRSRSPHPKHAYLCRRSAIKGVFDKLLQAAKLGFL